jgi:hypothetical protein
MSGGHDSRDDSNRLHTEFWNDAGALMKEIMDDFVFTKPVRVSLRDVQVRIRYRLAQAAETRETALREARAEIERLRTAVAELDVAYQNNMKLSLTYHGRIERLRKVADAARELLQRRPGALIALREAVAALDVAPDGGDNADERGEHTSGKYSQ